MGNLQASEMASLLQEDVALTWHLTSNHYPPIHLDFLPIAQQALKLARQDDYDTIIDMPNGISKSVADIIDGLHLETFL